MNLQLIHLWVECHALLHRLEAALEADDYARVENLLTILRDAGCATLMLAVR